MATLEIRDDALWARHIDDEAIRQRILSLRPDEPIHLRVAGRRLRFRKMRTGRDGRPTPGLRADASAVVQWRELQKARGTKVPIEMAEAVPLDPYLASLSPILHEWTSQADCEAFDGL